jgi:hypothetical protein
MKASCIKKHCFDLLQRLSCIAERERMLALERTTTPEAQKKRTITLLLVMILNCYISQDKRLTLNQWQIPLYI